MAGVDTEFRITRPLIDRSESTRASATTRSRIPKARAREGAERRIALTDPAVHVVTDFIFEPAVTVPQETSIDDALREMIRNGVRALIIVRDEVVIGLITSYDIQGERPLQFLAESGFRRHDEIEVGHIMTSWERVPTLDYQLLARACVSELVAFFRYTAATHVVVVEYAAQGKTAVRGLISRARLERQLGQSIREGP